MLLRIVERCLCQEPVGDVTADVLSEWLYTSSMRGSMKLVRMTVYLPLARLAAQA